MTRHRLANLTPLSNFPLQKRPCTDTDIKPQLKIKHMTTIEAEVLSDPQNEVEAGPVEAGPTSDQSPSDKTMSIEEMNHGTPTLQMKAEILDIQPPIPTLSPELIGELERHEDVIAKGQQTFLDVGRALAYIRDKALFHPYKDFQSYLVNRWHFTRQRGSQLTRAADLITVLETRVDRSLLPKTERAARELLKVSEDNRVAVLELAYKNSEGAATAEDILKAKRTIEPAKARSIGKERKKPFIKASDAVKASEKLASFLEAFKPNLLSPDQETAIRKHLGVIVTRSKGEKLVRA